MKQYLLVAFLLFMHYHSTAQSKTNFSIIAQPWGVFGTNSKQYEGAGGFAFGIGGTVTRDKNVLILHYEHGENLVFDDPAAYKFNQQNIMYGRNIRISKNTRLQPYIGAGLVTEKYRLYSSINPYIKSSAFGVPVGTRLFLASHTRRFDFGFSTGVNLNSIATAYHFSLIMEWNLKPRRGAFNPGR